MVAIPIVLYTGQALGQNDGYCHILITTAGHIMAGISEQVVTLTRSIVSCVPFFIFHHHSSGSKDRVNRVKILPLGSQGHHRPIRGTTYQSGAPRTNLGHHRPIRCSTDQ